MSRLVAKWLRMSNGSESMKVISSTDFFVLPIAQMRLPSEPSKKRN